MTAMATRAARSIADLRDARADLEGTVALVPTMGALHAGHLSLVERARELADHVVVSDFVNPLQFAPDEDYERYPRRHEADLALVDGHADLLFIPSVEEMYPGYPDGPLVRVSAGPMAHVFEGAVRPIHFDGVVTVVAKLFGIVTPDVAVFGQKDAQQLAIIRRLVADLNIPVRIEAVPIVRDEDGLALSSRNAYLDPERRARALALSRAVTAAARAETIGEARRAFAAELGGVDLDYAEIVDPATFRPAGDGFAGDALAVVAARFGDVRLIDNAPLTLH